jgi:hypothetical protein
LRLFAARFFRAGCGRVFARTSLLHLADLPARVSPYFDNRYFCLCDKGLKALAD